MAKKIFRFCSAYIVLVTFIIGSSSAGELSRIKILDRMMYTINPKASIEGPFFRDQADKTERSKYTAALVSLIMKEADLKARKYLDAGDTQGYYAFLTMALTVPLHEGLYIHFRDVDGDVCRAEANSGDLVKRASPTTYKIFAQYFKNSASPFFPNCDEMKNTVGVRQMIRGGDGTDLSIMQVSIRWHFDDFLANTKYESVRRTLNYGFNHLLNGFDPVYRNISDYKCILDGDSSKRKINYINLIRGVWAGKYNSGSISQTCRFADPNSPYKKHDLGFLKNLEKILSFNGVISTDFIGDLKLEGIYSEAFKEIVTNLKENRNQRNALRMVLAQ